MPAPFFDEVWRCIANNMAVDLLMNEEIRDREVRLIDQNGEQLGVLPIRRALEMAEEAGLDLVKIAATAKPPVCKLMDYVKAHIEQKHELTYAQLAAIADRFEISIIQVEFSDGTTHKDIK